MDFPEDAESQDTVQHLLNDAKRAELEERYGMRFSRVGNARVPPEIEGRWLDHIEEFERRLEAVELIPLRKFVALPVVRPLADLPSGAVEDELETLLDHLASHEVYVDFPDEVEAPEAYRFVTEELLDEPIVDIRMPGMRLHFVYGEFRA